MARKTVVVHVNDKMQRGYTYVLTARSGRDFDPEFRPDLTPKEMLALGVFCGKYMTDCRDEFPASWFARARLSPSGRDCSLNYFGVDATSRWRSGAARAGFIRKQSLPPCVPNSLTEFVDLVLPELRHRGLFRTEYEGRTLRDNLGLQRPNNGILEGS